MFCHYAPIATPIAGTPSMYINVSFGAENMYLCFMRCSWLYYNPAMCRGCESELQAGNFCAETTSTQYQFTPLSTIAVSSQHSYTPPEELGHKAVNGSQVSQWHTELPHDYASYPLHHACATCNNTQQLTNTAVPSATPAHTLYAVCKFLTMPATPGMAMLSTERTVRSIWLLADWDSGCTYKRGGGAK